MTSDLLYFEDFTVGRVFDCGSYAVSLEEILEFASEFDPQPHHLDAEAAANSLLEGLAASGWHTCAIVMRMLADGVILKADGHGGVGSRETRWLKPVRPGDVLRMEAEVVELKRTSSKPFGFVTLDCRLFNGSGQVALVSMTPIIGTRAP